MRHFAGVTASHAANAALSSLSALGVAESWFACAHATGPATRRMFKTVRPMQAWFNRKSHWVYLTVPEICFYRCVTR
jgi:hypothetical protein